MFPLEDRGTSFGSVFDGSSNTLLFVQADLDRAVPWTAPDDLFYDPDTTDADPGDGISESYLRMGTFAAFADGSTHFLSDCIPNEVLHRLIQKADGETVDYSGSYCNEGTVIPRPTVGNIRINTDESQRSSVTEIALTFDGSIDFEPDAFSITQRSDGDGVATGVPVAATFTCSMVDDDTVINITFDSHIRNDAGVLEDGNYQLNVDGSKVYRAGTDLALGANFVLGDSESDGFFSFYGDSNGDRRIDVRDLLGIRRAWQTSQGDADFDPTFDYNNDGAINVRDLLEFRRNYSEMLEFV